MKAWIEQLMQVIEQIIEEYQQLKTESEEHRQALIQGDMKQLNIAIDKVSTRIRRINQIEKARLHIGQEIATVLKVSAEQITASFLIERLDPVTGKRIYQLSKQCEEAVEQIRSLNEQNRVLTEQSLSYVKTMMEIFFEPDDGGRYGKDAGGYGAKAPSVPSSNGGRIFDIKA